MKSSGSNHRLVEWLDSARHLVKAEWQRTQEMRQWRKEHGRSDLADLVYEPSEPEPVEFLAARDPTLSLEDFVSVLKVDPKSIEWCGRTLVYAAAKAGELEKLRWLVEKGVNPKIGASYEDSPLIQAAELRSPIRDSVIRYLISLGVRGGANSALRLSLALGRFEIAREQVVAGADFSESPFSPLHQAAAWGSKAEVASAVQQGGNLEDPDRAGRTPWLIAVQAGRIDAAEWLERAGAITWATTSSGAEAMHLAAECNRAGMIRQLFNAGHDVNTRRGMLGYSPLDVAVTYDAPEAAAALLELGADLSQETIHHAKSGEVLELLFTHGADLNAIELGEWPLKALACDGNLAAVEWLLDHGALIDNCTDSGDTALFAAVYQNHLHIASLLLERGANPSAVDLDYDTPLSICRTPAMENLLLSYGAKTWPFKR